ERVPAVASSPFTVPLISAIDEPGEFLDGVIGIFLKDEHGEHNLFGTLNKVLYENLCAASGVSPGAELTKPLIWPSAAKMPVAKLVDTYFAGTPLHALLSSPYPFSLPDEQRFAGHWIIAPPGRGKTTLLHAMVADDLTKDASIVLMDSKGDLIEAFRDVKEIEDRLVLIDPDPQHPISINPLDIPRTEIGHAIDLLEYLFASLLEFKMTPTQTMLFRSVLRLIVTEIPNPTLDIFRDLLGNGTKKYEQYVEKLSPDLRDFFRNDYNDVNFSARRREVLQRLRLLLDNDTMNAMLLSVRTRFVIDDALDTGKVVIINNSKSRLGEQGAEFFGRFFIAQILAAAQRRSSRKQSDKKPVYFYIDEAHNVIGRDERIPTILDECRSQKIALILAHQRTNQITSPNVRSALENCAIRFANSDDEARSLSYSLRTSPDFLQSFGQGRFAAYVRDVTKSAIAIEVTKPDLAKYERLSAAEQVQLKARMEQQYGRQSAAAAEPSKPDAKPDPKKAAEPEADEPTVATDPGEPSDKW
ncbi:MAG: type IV secretory system conjugative DNA transfer family protein, partial [Vulcanimicrobiaceae bacterium]